jgi:hypothetical protein
MDKSRLTKLIVQTVAIAFGLIGLVWIYLGVEFAITGIRQSDRFALLCMTPMFFTLGGIVLAVAWQNLRRFGPNSIKNVTFLVVYSLYVILTPFDELSEETTWTRQTEFSQFVRFSIPLLLMFFVYSVVSRKLIQTTKAEDIQQANSGEPADTAP